MFFVCSTDIHVDVKPVCDEAHPCTCKRPYDPEVKGCGEECLNRYVTQTKHLSQPVFLSKCFNGVEWQITTNCIIQEKYPCRCAKNLIGSPKLSGF